MHFGWPVAIHEVADHLPDCLTTLSELNMRVLITGAAGMIGTKLAQRLAREGALQGTKIEQLTLHDLVSPVAPGDSRAPVRVQSGDLGEAGVAQALLADRPELIFHLAAIVSGQAEQEFETGYRVNLDGTRLLLEAIRAVGTRPRLVLASSIAVFGAPFPESIPDDFCTTPLTSYGTQKAICELLLCDYSRRGFLDGYALRLPTICVRPGQPNAAASGFFSNIIREPLAGHDALLPVGDEVTHWHASPRAAIRYLLHAATIDGERVGPRRALTMPGVAATVGEQIAALRQIAGDAVAARIRRQPDPFIQQMVAGWPRRFDARRALQLGFQPDTDFAEIIRIHIEDERSGHIA
jgi:nucleoside-diphosphate-sugar epimerase